MSRGSRARSGFRLVLLLACVSVGAYFARRYGLLSLLKDQDRLQQTILSYGVWAPVVFCGLRMVASWLMLPLAVLTLATAFLFPPVLAMAINVVTTWLAAMIAFYVARGAGRETVRGLLPAKLAKFDEGMVTNGFALLVFLRINPAFPFNTVSYWAGLTAVSTRDYATSTFVGMMPHVIVYSYLGAGLAELSPTKIGVAIAGLTVLSLLSWWLRKPRQE